MMIIEPYTEPEFQTEVHEKVLPVSSKLQSSIFDSLKHELNIFHSTYKITIRTPNKYKYDTNGPKRKDKY